MLPFLRRHWFLCLLAALLGAGFFFPHQLTPLVRWLPADVTVFAVLFLMSVTLDVRAMTGALRRPAAVLLAVGVNFVAVPLLAWPVALAIRPLSTDFSYGLLVAAAVPSTLASAAVWTRRAGGSETVPLLATLITNAACFAVTPFWVRVTTGQSAQVDAWGMAYKLALVCVLPVLAAQMVRLWRPAAAVADRRKRLLGIVSQFGILSFVLAGAVSGGAKLHDAESLEQVSLLAWPALIVSVVGIHLAAFALAYAVGKALRLPREDRLGAAFSGSQKTLMVGISTSQSAFGGLSMLPMIAYHVCQLLADTMLADRLARVGKLSEGASSPPPPAAMALAEEDAAEAGG
jgi:sodium/bile acid cotransporter 7